MMERTPRKELSTAVAACVKTALSLSLLGVATVVGVRLGLAGPAISPVSPLAIASAQPVVGAPPVTGVVLTGQSAATEPAALTVVSAPQPVLVAPAAPIGIVPVAPAPVVAPPAASGARVRPEVAADQGRGPLTTRGHGRD
jgi:hypothetical protein